MRRSRALRCGLSFLLCLFLLAPAIRSVIAAPANPDSARFLRVVNKLVAAINANKPRVIEKMFDPGMRDALPLEKAGPFFQNVVTNSGKIVKIGEPQIDGDVGRFRLSNEHGAWNLVLTLGPKDTITGIIMRMGGTPPPDIPVPDRNTVPMRLPCRGEWYVTAGGATAALNHHVMERNQRRAVDILIRDRNGRSFRGDGTRCDDYFDYGKEVLAPADGTVVTVIDGVPDNVPGSVNPYSTVGNCVIIKLAEYQYFVLAHMKPYSIVVKVGDNVRPGQLIGLCGNSGESTEPHIHFHLQNTAVLQDGTGFTPYFQGVNLVRDGKTSRENDYTPIRGDRIWQA